MNGVQHVHFLSRWSNRFCGFGEHDKKMEKPAYPREDCGLIVYSVCKFCFSHTTLSEKKKIIICLQLLKKKSPILKTLEEDIKTATLIALSRE